VPDGAINENAAALLEGPGQVFGPDPEPGGVEQRAAGAQIGATMRRAERPAAMQAASSWCLSRRETVKTPATRVMKGALCRNRKGMLRT
jgi:hypothetical protein